MKEFKNDVEAIVALSADFKRLKAEIGKVIIGQDEVVQNVLMSIFADGHSLLVGVPGLAKTLLIKTISDALHLSFKRIQFKKMPSVKMRLYIVILNVRLALLALGWAKYKWLNAPLGIHHRFNVCWVLYPTAINNIILRRTHFAVFRR